MDHVKRAIGIIEKIAFLGSCASILIIMFITAFDVLARKIVQYSIPSLYEFTEDYLMVALVFLSISYVYGIGGHVKVDLLERHFPESLKIPLQKGLSLLALLFFAIIALKGWDVTVRAFEFGEVSSSLLAYPLGPAFFLVPLGSALTCVRIVEFIFTGAGKKGERALGID